MKSARRMIARKRGPRTDERMTVREVRSEGRGRIPSKGVDEVLAEAELEVRDSVESEDEDEDVVEDPLSNARGEVISLVDGPEAEVEEDKEDSGEEDGPDTADDVGKLGAEEEAAVMSLGAAGPDGGGTLITPVATEAGSTGVPVGAAWEDAGDVSPPYIQSGPSGMDGP